MKKAVAMVGLLAVITLGSCARKANCPAYGSVKKAQPAAVRSV